MVRRLWTHLRCTGRRVAATSRPGRNRGDCKNGYVNVISWKISGTPNIKRLNEHNDFDGDTAESLVRSAQAGDRAAFRELFEIFHARVYRTAFRIIGERHRAEDIVQEVFITVFQRLPEFDFRSTFATWLYRVTVNACYADLRKRSRREKYYDRGRTTADLDPPERGEDGETSIRRKEVSRQVEAALRRLSPDLRATFVLRQMEGLSYDEISQVLDVSAGTVASRLARARAQLAEALRSMGIDQTYLK